MMPNPIPIQYRRIFYLLAILLGGVGAVIVPLETALNIPTVWRDVITGAQSWALATLGILASANLGNMNDPITTKTP